MAKSNVMIASGLMGGLSMIMAELIKRHGSLKKEMNIELQLSTVKTKLAEVLGDKEAYINTLGEGLEVINLKEVSSIKNSIAPVPFEPRR